MNLARMLLITPFLFLPVTAQVQEPRVVQQQLNRTFRTDIARNERGLNAIRDKIHELATRDEIHKLTAEIVLLRTTQESGSNALSEKAMWLIIISLLGERGIFHYKRKK